VDTKGYAEVNEDVAAYKVFGHSHTVEMGKAIALLSGTKPAPPMTFLPYLAPMTRGILATCFVKGSATHEECYAIAEKFYANSPFVRVLSASREKESVHTKWATGSNLVFVNYAKQGDTIIAFAAIDNLEKGAAGQAVQNANLMLELEATLGLMGAPVVP